MVQGASTAPATTGAATSDGPECPHRTRHHRTV